MKKTPKRYFLQVFAPHWCAPHHKRTGDVYQFHSKCQQPMESPWTAIRSHLWWQYKHKILCWWHFSWAKLLEQALLYMECQLCIYQVYWLSLSLRNSNIFPKHFKFARIDICHDRNCPATSKHYLLDHWSQPALVQDVAKIVRFAQFYGNFTPHSEFQIAPLCNLITKLEFTKPVVPHWMTAAQGSFTDIKQAILSDPCLKCFHHSHLIVLWSDFLSKGFGYIVCQPRSNTATTKAMNGYNYRSDFSVMTKDSMAVLHLVAFGALHCRGNEVRLYSHLGEGFSSDWTMNKCCHMLFGLRFIWITSCYAIRFIHSYNGANPAILCLQMRLMCWDVDIIHRNNC